MRSELKAALDGALAEQMKVLFSQLCIGLTTGLPKPDPKLATDRFATGCGLRVLLTILEAS
jgi:hypothetical protein